MIKAPELSSGFEDRANPGFGLEDRASPVFPQTFADEGDRARLSPVALKAMQGIAAHWRLRGHEVAALLGVSPSTWDRMAAGKWEQSLSQDQLTRVSAIVGVFWMRARSFLAISACSWVKVYSLART